MKLYLSVCLMIFSQLSVYSYADSHHPQDFLKSIAGSKDEGLQIYNHFCSNCHAQKPLISLGAPRFQEEVDWNSRLKQGVDTLFKHTEEGINAMPPRGGCFECTDKQLALSILAMIPKKTDESFLNDLMVYKKYKK